MIYEQSGFVSGDDPPGVPLIGHRNNISAVVASSAASGFPASNLLNSATHLFWRASAVGTQNIGLAVNTDVNYVGIAKHNFFEAGIRVGLATSPNADAVDGYLQLLTHFEGTNGSIDITDVSGFDRAIGVNTSGNLTNAQFKFGSMSSGLNGTGFLFFTGEAMSFRLDDFTVDLWIRITALGSVYYIFDTGDTGANGMSIRKTATNVLVFKANNVDRITGATALTTGTWHHVALTRRSGSTRLFLNGVQEGSTYADTNDYIRGGLAIFGCTTSATNFFNGNMDELRILRGRAEWTANFTAPTSAYADGLTSVVGSYSALLHFDGVDATTTMTDSSGNNHAFTAVGNAQLDTAQKQFGTASLLLDGTGDYLTGDGSDDFAFGSDDFTVDFWVRPNTTGTQLNFYDSRNFGQSTGAQLVIYKTSGNKAAVFVQGATVLTGTTNLTTGAWFHIAVTRTSGVTRLFVNGSQEGGTFSDSNVYTNSPTGPIIGAQADTLAASFWNGWIDELRVVKGTSLYSGFSFATPAHASGAVAVFGKTAEVPSSAPLIFRFTSTFDFINLQLASGSEAAQMAVIYAGILLVLERGVKADVGHIDIVHARRSNVLSGMSESGNFLGRVLVSEWRESAAEFAWFTPDWYRDNFESFVIGAMTDPFFWAWNPDEYPEETAFAWIIDDIQPETDPATRRMAATISMRAIV